MTNRAGQPDTNADIELRRYLDQQPPSCFTMVAGAGSGKTTSLVKALVHLARTRAPDLRRRGQLVACITYTEVAVREIRSDIGDVSLFHVSTIHSFLWTIVRSFQCDLRQWVAGRIEERIVNAQAKLDRPGTRVQTKEKATRDIESYQRQLAALDNIARYTYGMGSDYANGVLGHDDVLKVGPAFIEKHALLRTLIANQFPFIFVDESQDTNPAFVAALKQVANTATVDFCLGFFGDPMQKIYMTGVGPIESEDGWNRITKPENFRCPKRVLDVANRIRAEADGLQQVRGRMIERNDELVTVEGTARLFILPADGLRIERITQVRHWLAKANGDAQWESDGPKANFRVLVLVHRMAARRLHFPNLYAALNDHGAPLSLKAGLLDGTAWVVRPFLQFLLPLTLAARSDSNFDVMASLRMHCPLLREGHLAGRDIGGMLCRLQDDVRRLLPMFAGGSRITIREVLGFVRDRNLMELDERFIDYLDDSNGSVEDSDQNAESGSVNAFLDCTADELTGYRTYIEDESPFATQQGIKGAEFDRVLVILDDEEGKYNLFSYGKYFGITTLSDKDKLNIASGLDSVIDRTRRLFYVCCSRAVKDLAVILFVPDIAAACGALERKAFFPTEHTYLLSDLDRATA